MTSKKPQNKTGSFEHIDGSALIMILIGVILTSFLRNCISTQPPIAPSVALPPDTPIVKYTRGMSEAAVNRVELLCASLPTPERFEFASKTAPSETEEFVSVGYTFRSSRATSEIYPTFILWFTQNGWTSNSPVSKPLEFSKENQTVWLAPFHMKKEGDFYIVKCTEWKIPPKKP